MTSPSPAAAPRPPRLRTPGKLTLAIAASVIASLFIAGYGLWLGLNQSSLLGRAADRSGEVVSLLGVETDLTLAHATTTNAFLVGGLEPSDLRIAADEAFLAGATGLASQAGAAGASGRGHADEANELAAASADVALYAGLIEQARAANRQGFPVGVAYLDQATTLLGEDVLPVIDEAAVTTADGVARDFNHARGQVWLLVIALVPLGGLIAIQVWLSRRTKRRYNVPFAIGTGLALLAGLGLAVALESSGTEAERVRESYYVPTLAVAQALSEGAQARSDEAFTLIRRGSGAAYEESFQANMSSARANLERGRNAPTGTAVFTPLIAAIADWEEAHGQIRALDDAGDWEGAVALATTRDPGSPSEVYQTFANEADATITWFAQETETRLGRAQTAPVVAGWLIAAAGLACAALSARGLSNRLKEYR